MNICQSLTSTARYFPERVALIWNDRSFTYAELDALSASAARVFWKSRAFSLAIESP